MCWHRWGKWEDNKKLDIIQSKNKQPCGIRIVQVRRCEKCNKIESRMVQEY